MWLIFASNELCLESQPKTRRFDNDRQQQEGLLPPHHVFHEEDSQTASDEQNFGDVHLGPHLRLSCLMYLTVAGAEVFRWYLSKPLSRILLDPSIFPLRYIH